MPTDHDTHEPPDDVAPSATVHAPQPAPGPDNATATAGASRLPYEASIREWEGLPPDTIILVPACTAVPMRCPGEVWAMLVSAVDIVGGDTDPDHVGEVALFAGQWVSQPPPPAHDLYDGDLVVGHWYGVDDRWPHVVAPTAAAVMGLHCDLAGAAVAEPAPLLTSPPQITWARGGGVAALLDAGLVAAGDELVWTRRKFGVRHTARVRADGALVLADGRGFPNPTGATTALGGHLHNGWGAWRRVTDRRTLDDLRAELQARPGHQVRTT